MKIEDIIEQVNQTGQPVNIEFSKQKDKQYGVEDLECYANPGMRARITGGLNKGDDASIIHVDYAPFEEHNRGFETADYWGRGENGQQALMDARAAGKYKAEDKLYTPSSIEMDQLFTVLDGSTNALIKEWRDSDQKDGYVRYLEIQVIQLRAQQHVDNKTVDHATQEDVITTKPRAPR
jgi:hypothetical protein